jgi:hypothetical protein
VFAAAWRGAAGLERPTFHRVHYDSMADDSPPVDEAHMFERHFDRHVWIYRVNPNGMFTPLNLPESSSTKHTPQCPRLALSHPDPWGRDQPVA